MYIEFRKTPKSMYPTFSSTFGDKSIFQAVPGHDRVGSGDKSIRVW